MTTTTIIIPGAQGLCSKGAVLLKVDGQQGRDCSRLPAHSGPCSLLHAEPFARPCGPPWSWSPCCVHRAALPASPHQGPEACTCPGSQLSSHAEPGPNARPRPLPGIARRSRRFRGWSVSSRGDGPSLHTRCWAGLLPPPPRQGGGDKVRPTSQDRRVLSRVPRCPLPLEV